MNATRTDELGTHAATIMMHGAADVLRAAGITRGSILDDVVAELKAAASKAVDEAQADAREALDANMSQVATATWTATFRAAGARAARKVLDR